MTDTIWVLSMANIDEIGGSVFEAELFTTKQQAEYRLDQIRATDNGYIRFEAKIHSENNPHHGGDFTDAIRNAAEFEKETAELLQNVGDGIADVFDQLLKGKWQDEHKHDVGKNTAMLALKDRLADMIKFRAKWLGMDDPTKPL